MPEPGSRQTLHVNRAPVLTLWAAVVAQRLGHGRAAALTLGHALAGLNAQSKAGRLGLSKPAPADGKKRAAHRARAVDAESVELLGRKIPAVRTPKGLRALEHGKPADPASVERYLESKFGEALPAARAAMSALAKSRPPRKLAEEGFALYERFRPEIPRGTRGWGAKGVLDLQKIRELAR